MSASTVLMLMGAVLLFALFTIALAWAQLQARRFTTAAVEVRKVGDTRRRCF